MAELDSTKDNDLAAFMEGHGEWHLCAIDEPFAYDIAALEIGIWAAPEDIMDDVVEFLMIPGAAPASRNSTRCSYLADKNKRVLLRHPAPVLESLPDES